MFIIMCLNYFTYFFMIYFFNDIKSIISVQDFFKLDHGYDILIQMNNKQTILKCLFFVVKKIYMIYNIYK